MAISSGFALNPSGGVRAFDGGCPLETGEVAFDHWPSEAEISAAFPVLLQTWDALAAQAQVLLDKTDQVALRCWKAGVAWPAEWQASVVDLRAYLISKDASKPVPSLPMTKDSNGHTVIAYPAGS
jgi:hypothetical protein